MTYHEFLSELDVLVRAEKLEQAKKLLDTFPEYRDQYEKELDSLREEADGEQAALLHSLDVGRFYDRLVAKLREE